MVEAIVQHVTAAPASRSSTSNQSEVAAAVAVGVGAAVEAAAAAGISSSSRGSSSSGIGSYYFCVVESNTGKAVLLFLVLPFCLRCLVASSASQAG